MATNNTSSSNPRAEKMGDVLDALSSGIAKTAANEPKFEPKLLVPEVPAEPAPPREPPPKNQLDPSRHERTQRVGAEVQWCRLTKSSSKPSVSPNAPSYM